MPALYATQRINFDSLTDTDLPRYEYHRTLRSAISLSATSYSQQRSLDGALYQWDNIAPEIALVILQNAQKQKINIQEEVIQEIGVEAYNKECLKKAIERLQSNPRYTFFIQKLALHCTNKKSKELTVENLNSAGIVTLKQFNDLYTQLLYAQNKLTKSFPDFSKITAEDDYYQFVHFIANEPLYEFFLLSLTQYLASEFNKGRTSNHIEAPKEIHSKSLFNFFQSISYDLTLQQQTSRPLQANTLYITVLEDKLSYSVIEPGGLEITDTIHFAECNFSIDKNISEEELKNHLPDLLQITSLRNHTRGMAIHNHVEVLKDKGIAFLESDIGSSLFLSHLPAIDLIQDEEYKFTLYQWLKQGNLDRLKDFWFLVLVNVIAKLLMFGSNK